ncbi:MAG: hypothetical protein LBR61_09455 [Synergistaceae bacterium]|jgi:hypothetical protein|nr:hypothetical protein [Synergistaceae bacterium]
MAELILVTVALFFVFGLVQWARGGAALWDVIRLSRFKPAVDEEKDEEDRQKEEARRRSTLREMERLTDRMLRSSFKVLGILALCIWFFVVASVIIDALGLDWLDSLSFQANRIWGDPATRATSNTSQTSNSSNRTNILRSIRSGLRR